MMIATMAALALASQITDGGRTAYDMPASRVVVAPADGTRDIRESIRNGRRAGQLSRREARALRRETRAIEAIGARAAADGLSASEAHEIAVRTEAQRGLVTAARTRGVSAPSTR